MNSANAHFWVQETAYVVRSLSHHVYQATGENGYVTSTPVCGELRLALNVRPHDVLLPTWAHNPQLALPAELVFDSLDGVSSPLALTLEEAYCVSYEEHFETNPDGEEASFYCIISVVARVMNKRGVAYVNHWPATTK